MRPLYMLTSLVFAQKLFIYRSPHVHMALVCLCRGKGGSGGGQVILKRTDNPRKERP